MNDPSWQSGQVATKSSKTLFANSSIFSEVRFTISSVRVFISSIKISLLRFPLSICFSLYSHSPVSSGDLNASIPMSFNRSMRANPLFETTRSLFCCSCLKRYLCAIRPSIIAALVAGVPSPRSFIASFNSSSSILLPAVSIAPSKVASLYRAGGFVTSDFISISAAFAWSPVSAGISSFFSVATPGLRP